MKFKGDIIITDPCYIMKEDDRDLSDMPNPKDYVTCSLAEDPKKFWEQTQQFMDAQRKWEKENADDWERCNYSEDMGVLGFTTYLTRDTIYGDWSCTTYNTETKEKLGSFCADAGLVGVFLLSEVLDYNRDFDYHVNRPWTTTWIRDFDGDIEIQVVDGEVRVVGVGNVNFFTTQTGL